MLRLNESVRVRSLCVFLGAALLSLGPTAVAGDSKADPKAEDQGSVKDNVKQLGKEVSDPSTLDRIKAHEQQLEKKVKRKRASQRKDHGEARPSDAVELAKDLDKPAPSGGAPAKADAKPDTKKKAEAAPPPAPPAAPTATKAPAPAR